MKKQLKHTIQRCVILFLLMVFLFVFGQKAIVREDVRLSAASFVQAIDLDQHNSHPNEAPKSQRNEPVQNLASASLPLEEAEGNFYIDCTWDDENNEAGDRPKEVNFDLINEEETQVYSYSVSEGDEWVKKMTHPAETSDYKVSVDVPKGYECRCQKKQRKGYCLITLLLTRSTEEERKEEEAESALEYE